MKLGLYIGRFQPLHKMHIRVMSRMFSDFGYDRSIIIVGSAETYNEKNIFTFEERKQMIKNVFPRANFIIPLKDYYDDDIWRAEVQEICESVAASLYENWATNHFTYPSDVTLYAGCKEDVLFFENVGFSFKFFERKVNSDNNVSGTKIRKAINNKDVEYIREYIPEKNWNLVLSRLEKSCV